MWNLSIFTPLLFLPSTDLSPVPSKYNEEDYSHDDNSNSNSEDNDEQDTGPIPMPDPVHMPQEHEEIPQRGHTSN